MSNRLLAAPLAALAACAPDPSTDVDAGASSHAPRTAARARSSGAGPVDPPAVTAVLEADATVSASAPNTNFGAATSLSADTSPATEIYLRFRVSGAGSTAISGARLRFAVSNFTSDAPAVYAADDGWSESAITWNARPPRGATPHADLGAVAAVAEYDVSDVVTGDGLYTFVLVPTSTDGFTASSKEGATAPVLLLGDGAGFRFTAVGDHGSSSSASEVFDLAKANGDFLFSLGDLGYGGLMPETAWCDYVKGRLGSSYPVVVVAGNHEARAASGGGVIEKYVASGCLPNPMSGVVGEYGKQFYFDYPAGAPLVRFVAFSPMKFDNGTYGYGVDTARYEWVASAIDEARAEGIPWVIAVTHLNCITVGEKPCELGRHVFNLLVAKKVDLILQGHEHNYQRSKQLAHEGGCDKIVPDAYSSSCVADSGSDGIYTKGEGTVVVISGAGGRELSAGSSDDAEAGYFATFMTSLTYGLTRFTVTATRLDAVFLRAAGGDHADHFSIVAP